MVKAVRLFRRRERKAARRRTVLAKRRAVNRTVYDRAKALVSSRFDKEVGRTLKTLIAPTKLNLSDAYVETVEFLDRVRLVSSHFRHKLFIDLRPVQEITSAGALALVSIIDQWRLRAGFKKLWPLGLKDWNDKVRQKLTEMGFFEILNAQHAKPAPTTSSGETFLRFHSGRGSEGEQARSLRRNIEAFGPKLADSGALYDGLVEAMTNVKHHAYSPSDNLGMWWMSASVDVNENRLRVMFIDHGRGIPNTLPKSRIWENVRSQIARLGLEIKNDAELIKAALTTERSQTLDDHRGRGLKQDVRGYIESHKAKGTLRIISYRGKCKLEKHADGEEVFETETLPLPLRGTFIEWTIEEYALNESH